MRTFGPVKLFLQVTILLIFCPQVHAADAETSTSYLTGGFGIEQLTYKEQIPDLELDTSDTEMLNRVLYLDGQKGLQKFFVGTRGQIPLSTDKAQEQWNRRGVFEQADTLTYKWTRISVRGGYFLNRLLNPYTGINWGYAVQKRSNFKNVNTPDTTNFTATEEVNAFSAILGIQGGIPVTRKWSFSYFAEYMLPFHSTITNNNLPGWEATDVGGYTISLTGVLHYAFSEKVSAVLQVTGGRQHWEGSDWSMIGDSRVKWPENNTDFISGIVSISRNF